MNYQKSVSFNIAGLFAVLLIFSALLFQIVLFNHVLGPIFFTIVSAFITRQSLAKDASQQKSILQVLIFVLMSNLFYLWLEYFDFLKNWIHDSNFLSVFHILFSVVMALSLSRPFKEELDFVGFFIYTIATLFIAVECSVEFIWAAIGINMLALIIALNKPSLLRNTLFSMSVVLYLIVSNVVFLLLPSMEGRGINFIYKVANYISDDNNIKSLVIHLVRYNISVVAGFSFAILAKFVVRPTDNSKQSSFLQENMSFTSSLVSIFIVFTISILLVYITSGDARKSFSLSKNQLLYSSSSEKFSILTVPKSYKLKILRKKGKWLQVMTPQGVRGWVTKDVESAK